MKIKEITSYLESLVPLNYQESYDNCGLIVGNANDDCTGVIISLDCVETIVDEAIEKGCNLIISHHPIVFKGLKKINGNNYVERTVIKAIKNDIAIYAIHTNLDNVHFGVNQMICETLGLVNAKVLVPKNGQLCKLVTFCPDNRAAEVRDALFAAGCGHIGSYENCSFNQSGKGTFKGGEDTNPYVGKKGELHMESEMKIETIMPVHLKSKVVKVLLEAHPYEEVAFDILPLINNHPQVGSGMIAELETPMDEMDFLVHLKTTMNAHGIRYTNLLNKKIKNVAVCGGAGSFLLHSAKAAGADVFITGDFKYHEFFDAENQLLIADIGHYESEQYTKQLIYRILIEKFPTFALHLSTINTNPINYL